MPAQKDFWISRQKRLSMSAMRVCVPGAQYFFWGSKNSFFLSFGQGVYIFEESQIKMLLEMSFVLATFVSTERMLISWRLCRNSEIHLWLWKVLSMVVCSQSSFYVTRTRKDDTNRQNTLVFAEKGWTCYPTNNC